MKNRYLIIILLIIIGITVLSNSNQPAQNLLNPSSFVTQIISPTTVSSGSATTLNIGKRTKTSGCVSIDELPDKSCTPGDLDPKVTQDNIQQTICVSGYTTKVRPSSSYTTNLKIQQIGEYGFLDTNTSDYEEDHLISLELGGSPTDPANLWPEPGASPNPKDKIENQCHKMVCSGQITLSDAQLQIASDWHTACQ